METERRCENQNKPIVLEQLLDYGPRKSEPASCTWPKSFELASVNIIMEIKVLDSDERMITKMEHEPNVENLSRLLLQNSK